MNGDERRANVYQDLNEMRERITRLEALQETGTDGQRLLAKEMAAMAREQHAMGLKLAGIEAQRNSVIAAAAFVGAVVTWLGKGLFDLMVRGGK